MVTTTFPHSPDGGKSADLMRLIHEFVQIQSEFFEGHWNNDFDVDPVVVSGLFLDVCRYREGSLHNLYPDLRNRRRRFRGLILNSAFGLIGCRQQRVSMRIRISAMPENRNLSPGNLPSEKINRCPNPRAQKSHLFSVKESAGAERWSISFIPVQDVPYRFAEDAINFDPYQVPAVPEPPDIRFG